MSERCPTCGGVSEHGVRPLRRPPRGKRRSPHRQAPTHPFVFCGRVGLAVFVVVGISLFLGLTAGGFREIGMMQQRNPVVTWGSIDDVLAGVLWWWISRQIVQVIHEMGHVVIAIWPPRVVPVRVTFASVIAPVITRHPWPWGIPGEQVFYRSQQRQWGRVQAGWRHWGIPRQVIFLLAGNGITLIASGWSLHIFYASTLPLIRWGCFLFTWAATYHVAVNSWPWPGRALPPRPGRTSYRWRLRQDGTRLWYLRTAHSPVHDGHESDVQHQPDPQLPRNTPRAHPGRRKDREQPKSIADVPRGV